jgi:hypothetical protein
MTSPVIIVGAPRSGTNMLRDVLTSAPGITTWDCDEINPLWKHGNLDIPHDEIPVERATPQLAQFLHRRFNAIARKAGADIVVEKTCAVSLRVPFTRALFPEAKYVFIHRDGIDATASTMQRWNASFDLRYTLKKARYVPPFDVVRHATALLHKRVNQFRHGQLGDTSNDLRVQTWWGPRPHDFRELQGRHPLEELAFIQWQRCVEQASAGLAGLPASQLHTVSYEDYVSDPRDHTARILEFMGRPELIDAVTIGQVSTASIGKGRRVLGPEAVARLERLGAATLERFGHA